MITSDLIKEIEKHKDEVIELRRYFHENPEVGFDEYNTQKFIINYLNDLEINNYVCAKTGVVGLIEGCENKKTLLLRADMDALPVQEENQVDYKSKNDGVMHACGHDGHTAMLLVAAKILNRNKDKIKGNIKLVFQPNEEDAGAYLMVEEGVLENPKVDACMGIHLWTPIDVGKISICEGGVMGAHANFFLDIMGKGGHSSMPYGAVDPILVGSQIVNNVLAITAKQIDALKPTVINVSTFKAGGAATNIIPDTARLTGTIRYTYNVDEKSDDDPIVKFEKIVAGVCEMYGAKYNLESMLCNRPVVNDAGLVNEAKNVAKELIGENNLVSYTTMAGEDFSEFGQNIPSLFYFVGAGNNTNAKYEHHHPKFDIDENSLVIGVKMHVLCALDYLNK